MHVRGTMGELGCVIGSTFAADFIGKSASSFS